MTNRNKLGLAAALVAVASLWYFWPASVVPPTAPPAKDTATLAAPARGELDQGELGQQAIAAAAHAPGVERQAVTSENALLRKAETGKVVVHVRYGDDKQPVANLPMSLRQLGRDARYSSLRATTDVAGTASFDSVSPGKLYVSPIHLRGKRVEVVAGETSEVDIELRLGMNLQGIVVNRAGAPVAGALIETAPMAHADAFPEVMAVSGADGRFAIRAASTLLLVGARAVGYVASNVKFLHGKEGNSPDIRLVLGPEGGVLNGTIVDGEGKPVANAIIVVGKGELSGIAGREHIPPFAALARSDESGHFSAIGLESGKQPVRCRASGFAPYEGECDVAVGTSSALLVTLAAGASMHGVVLAATGKPASRAEVRIGTWSDFSFVRTRTQGDGTFALTGLPAGELKVKASHDELGKGEQVIVTEPGKTATAELTLSRGLELRGRVVDPDGNPIAKAYCQCMAERGGKKPWSQFSQTNAQGEFVADNCPKEAAVTIRVSARGFEDLRQAGMDPQAGSVVLQLQRQPPRTVRIRGTVVAPDGSPMQGVSVSAYRKGLGAGGDLQATDKLGCFELGPYPPGTWTVHVYPDSYPAWRSDSRELSENATWELGTVGMQRGGTAIVRQVGDVEAKAYFVATDVAMKASVGFTTIDGVKKSSAMLPGDYVLLVRGKGVAATSQRFSVRVDEQTELTCEVRKGTDQSIRVVRGDGKKLEPFSVLVYQGEDLVARTYAHSQSDGSVVAEACLGPGQYRARASVEGLSGSATLDIAAVAGAQVVITLR